MSTDDTGARKEPPEGSGEVVLRRKLRIPIETTSTVVDGSRFSVSWSNGGTPLGSGLRVSLSRGVPGQQYFSGTTLIHPP